MECRTHQEPIERIPPINELAFFIPVNKGRNIPGDGFADNAITASPRGCMRGATLGLTRTVTASPNKVLMRQQAPSRHADIDFL
jgi:hypothetical protein